VPSGKRRATMQMFHPHWRNVARNSGRSRWNHGNTRRVREILDDAFFGRRELTHFYRTTGHEAHASPAATQSAPPTAEPERQTLRGRSTRHEDRPCTLLLEAAPPVACLDAFAVDCGGPSCAASGHLLARAIGRMSSGVIVDSVSISHRRAARRRAVRDRPERAKQRFLFQRGDISTRAWPAKAKRQGERRRKVAGRRITEGLCSLV